MPILGSINAELMPEYFHAAYIVGCKRNTAISSNKPKYTFLLVTSVYIEHIKLIHSKLSGSLYALNTSNNFVPTKSLNTLYHSLVHTRLTHGVVLWGGTFTSHLKRTTTCQKNAVHIIHNKPYNYLTSQLFKQSNILKFNDLYDIARRNSFKRKLKQCIICLY